ncbi:MAG: hypothetical protein QXY45_00440 [Candidatus Aenigmatarchaeota archaeon]
MDKIRKSFNPGEIRDLVIVILFSTLLLSIPDLKSNLILYLFLVSVGLFLRQIIHKIVADKLQCTTTFKLWPIGFFIGLISIFLRVYGLVFLALGYIEIVPYKFGRWGIKLIRMTPRDYAYISLAGLGVNLLFLLFFGILYTINPLPIFQTIALINGLLSFFSLLPIPPLEGSHIFTWSLWTWATIFFLNIIILIIIML